MTLLRRIERLELNTPIAAVLVPERAPVDNLWRQVCSDVGVDLVAANEIEMWVHGLVS